MTLQLDLALNQLPWPGEWTRRAACRGRDLDEFFPTRGDTTTPPAVCGRCPVMNHCLDYGLEHTQLHGIWGGMGQRARRREARRRRLPGWRRQIPEQDTLVPAGRSIHTVTVGDRL